MTQKYNHFPEKTKNLTTNLPKTGLNLEKKIFSAKNALMVTKNNIERIGSKFNSGATSKDR